MAHRLEIDRIRCDGYGMCAEILPEMIALDDWGYPILRNAPVPRHLREHAERAVDVCPVLALRLEAAYGDEMPRRNAPRRRVGAR